MTQLLIRKIFISFLFIILLTGELSFQIFTNSERTLVNLSKMEQKELDAIHQRDDVIREKMRAAERANALENAKNVYVELNRRALSRKELFSPYSRMIVEADKQIEEIWKQYFMFVSQRESLIRNEYASRRKNASGIWGKLTGIQYGFSASLMAIALAFFSTVVHTFWKWILFAASFVAQYTACMMIYHGAILKFNDESLAIAFSSMFLLCTPLAFHFGTLLFKNYEIVNDEIGDEIGVEEPAVAFVKTRKETEMKVSKSHTVTEEVSEIPMRRMGWRKICKMVANGELDFSERKIMKMFPQLTRYKVREELKKYRVSPALLEDMQK